MAVVQYTFTHKQYTERHETKNTIVRKFKDSHNDKDLENLMEMCVCVCAALYGLDEDQWQAFVNKVTNIEVPYNVYICIVSGGRISNLEMEAVCSQTLIPTR